MGNWRTLVMTGSVDPDEVEALRTEVTIRNLPRPSTKPNLGNLDPEWEAYFAESEEIGPLSIYEGYLSMFGLSDWVWATIDARGNVGKDVSVKEIVDHLAKLVQVAPSLALVVDVGGEWESEDCVATIVVHDRAVILDEPHEETVTGISMSESMARLVRLLNL